MKLVTFDEGRVGTVVDGRVVELDVSDMRRYFELGGKVEPTGREVALEDVRLRAPLIPRKFFHTAGNFREHHEESERVNWSHPVLPWIVFFQNVDASIGPDDPLDLLVAPGAAGLFHRTIVQSPPLGDLAGPPEQARQRAEDMSARGDGAAFDPCSFGRFRPNGSSRFTRSCCCSPGGGERAARPYQRWMPRRSGALPRKIRERAPMSTFSSGAPLKKERTSSTRPGAHLPRGRRSRIWSDISPACRIPLG